MDELDRYLTEQNARRVRQLEERNRRLQARLGGGETPDSAPDRHIHDPRLDEAEADREVLLRRLRKAEERAAELEQILDEVLSSRSWRFLRMIGIAKR